MNAGDVLGDDRDIAVARFHDRPFQVIHLGGGFAEAIRRQISDPAVKRIADRRRIGGIDQWSDSTDLLADAQWRRTLRKLYSEEG